MPPDPFPLYKLSKKSDWDGYWPLLQSLQSLSQKRNKYIESKRAQGQWNDDEETVDAKAAAGEIYSVVNSSGLFSNDDLNFPVQKYRTIFHPDSVKPAMIQAGFQPNDQEIERNIKGATSIWNGKTVEFQRPLDHISKLVESQLLQPDFAKNAGSPQGLYDLDMSDSDNENDENENVEPKSPVNLKIIPEGHKKHQKALQNALTQSYNLVKTFTPHKTKGSFKADASIWTTGPGEIGEQLLQIVKTVEETNKKIRDDSKDLGLPPEAGEIPIRTLCDIWANENTSEDVLLRVWISAQLPWGYFKQPPEYDGEHPTIGHIAQFYSCDANTGLPLPTSHTPPSDRTPEQNPVPGSDQTPPAQSPVPRSGQTPPAQNPVPGGGQNLPAQNPIPGIRQGIPVMPMSSSSGAMVRHGLNLQGPIQKMKTAIQLKSGYITTDEIKPGYTIQGDKIVAFKTFRTVIPSQDGVNEGESHRFVIEKGENSRIFQYKSQDECGGGAVWAKLLTSGARESLLEIDKDKDQLHKSTFNKYGTGLSWAAFPPEVSLVATSRPRTILGCWWADESGKRHEVALTWTTYKKVVGENLAETLISAMLERGQEVSADTFKMNGVWDALQYVQPSIMPPDGTSKFEREARLHQTFRGAIIPSPAQAYMHYPQQSLQQPQYQQPQYQQPQYQQYPAVGPAYDGRQQALYSHSPDTDTIAQLREQIQQLQIQNLALQATLPTSSIDS